MFNMLGIIINNLVSKPSTRSYPVERRKPYKDTRGQIEIDIDNCTFCFICSKKCTTGALLVNNSDMTLEINHFKCLVCGACAEACPRKCIYIGEDYIAPSYAREKALFTKSSKAFLSKNVKAFDVQEPETYNL